MLFVITEFFVQQWNPVGVPSRPNVLDALGDTAGQKELAAAQSLTSSGNGLPKP